YCIKATAFDPEGIPGDDITVYQITPPVPGDVQVSLTLRSMGMAVYWQPVRGADLYYAQSSIGQNCTSTNGEPYCIISPLNCSENHLVVVTALNEAGPSTPSQPEAQITPCPPDSVEVGQVDVGNCSVSWGAVEWVDYYVAYVKRDDGAEEQCNTTSTTCYYNCDC
uniref:Fibronectin type-III domain-containing protein n=1 Tax=Astyanax mexicanus TaxID=7994 RepID=A0A3B1J6D9_ASTMX